jgi:hypothetical protein
MRKLIIALGALTVLAGCSSQTSVAPAPKQITESMPQPSVTAPQRTSQTAKEVTLKTTPVATKPALKSQASSQFNFPQASCGDKSSEGNAVWYPVFVDRGNLETIRRNFCADAVSTVREDSKIPSVQLASFINRNIALEFAKAVGGDVGQPTSPKAVAPSPEPQAKSVVAKTTSSDSVAFDEATLTASDSNSQINLRDTPSETGKRLGYGLVGDRVEVLKQTTFDSYTWYRVRFPSSGAVGWIRGDFVEVASASQTSQPSSEPYSSSSSPTYTTPTYTSTTTSSGGNCNSPDDVDSRGHRCGGRAASVRAGGRGRRR